MCKIKVVKIYIKIGKNRWRAYAIIILPSINNKYATALYYYVTYIFMF